MRTINVAVSLTIWLALSTTMAVAQEPVDAPETRPLVLIDAAHHNVYRAANRASIIEFLEKDGYRVRELLRGRFDRESLDGVQIIIIENALSAQNALPSIPPTEAELAEAWRLPTPSAFAPEEIAILSEWVAMGGALLLDFDHMPMSGAAQELAEAFGIEVSNGYAVDERSLLGVTGEHVGRAGASPLREIPEANGAWLLLRELSPLHRARVGSILGSSWKRLTLPVLCPL